MERHAHTDVPFLFGDRNFSRSQINPVAGRAGRREGELRVERCGFPAIDPPLQQHRDCEARAWARISFQPLRPYSFFEFCRGGLIVELVDQAEGHKEDEGEVDHKEDFVDETVREEICHAAHQADGECSGGGIDGAEGILGAPCHAPERDLHPDASS